MLKKYENPDVSRMIALLGGLKRFMHSIFQFFKTRLLDELSHNNVLYNLGSGYVLSLIVEAMNSTKPN